MQPVPIDCTRLAAEGRRWLAEVISVSSTTAKT